MNNLLTRTISGIIFIVLIIGALLLGEHSTLILILLIYSIALYEFGNIFKIREYLISFLILIGGQFFLIISFLGYTSNVSSYILPVTMVGIMITLFLTYLLKHNSSLNEIGKIFFGGIWFATSLFFYLGLGWIENEAVFSPVLMIILLAFVWINDVGAYVFGSLLGKRPLAPEISPGKTWEGFTGGILLNGAAGAAIYKITGDYDLYFWVAIGVLISMASTIGDLFESKLKREAGVKDSGTLIPGHGGILDRFDSLLFSAPLFYLAILIFG